MSISVLDGQWEFLEKIGDHSNGQVHRIKNIQYGTERGIKLDENGWGIGLQNEAIVHNELEKAGCLRGFQRRLYYGTGIINGSKRQTVLVTSLPATNVNDLRESNGCCLSIISVLLFGRQAVLLLKQLHKLGVVHNNIKPENFVLGTSGTAISRRVYLVDFGMCTRFKIKDNHNWVHIEAKKDGTVESTLQFGSHRANGKYVTSPRDDLESLFYVMVYLVKGLLPWRIPTQLKFNSSGTEKTTLRDEVCHLKRTISTDILCEGLPAQMDQIFTYVRNLDSKQTPNYDYINTLLYIALRESKHTFPSIELE